MSCPIWHASLGRSLEYADWGVLATDTHLRLQLWNRWLEEQSGYSRDEVLGRSLTEVFPDLDQGSTLGLYQQALEGQVVICSARLHDYLFPLPSRHVPGLNRMRQSAWILPLMNDNTVIGTVTFIFDVTDRYLREEELKEYIQELRSAQSQLRQSEEHYRLIFNHSPLGLLHFDVQGVITEINDRLVEILGVTRETLLGVNLLTTLQDDRVLTAVRQTLEGKHSFYQGVYRSVFSGRQIPLRAHFRSIVEASGQIEGGVILIEDISDQFQAEQARQQAETEKAIILDNIQDMIYFQDPERRIIRANWAAAQAAGLTPEEMVGRFCYELCRQETGACERCPVTVTLQTGQSREAEVVYPEGQVLLVRSYPVADEEQRLQGIVRVATDITARREAEQTLTHLVTHAPWGIYIAQDGLFRLVNPGFSKIFGYSPEELIGRSCLSLVVPEQREQVRQQAIKMLRGESQTPYEFQVLTRTGERRWLMEQVVSTYYQGKRSTLGYALDITARKQLEEQFLQAQKMEAVGRLAGGIAHDFNNMLNVITGYCDLLELDLDPRDPMREQLEHIRRAADQAANLTRQLLAFSRKQIIQPQVIDLNDRLTSTARMLRRLLGEDIELLIAGDPYLAPILIDPNQLDQIIFNLAVNARDAMPQGGRLYFETRNLMVTFDSEHPYLAPGAYVQLTVTDTGQGMNGATLQKIFEPYFTTKPEGKGTGLGLATVYGIIKQNHGHIMVNSEPGRGTTFKIYFPQAAATPMAAKLETQIELAKGQETILVVEDEDLLRHLICRTLQHYGYRVLEARNGGEALLLCEQHSAPIHLLLTDVIMPRLPGPQLATRLRALHPEMQVLYMSGYAVNTNLQADIASGKVNFIHKPFAAQELIHKIRRIFDHQDQKLNP